MKSSTISDTKTKIVQIHKNGPAEVLQFEDVPTPSPGPEEVQVQVKAIGLNRSEILFREGHYNRYYNVPLQFPAKVGTEASGIVTAVGTGVDPSWVGKRVGTIPGTFDSFKYGVYGEVVVVPASAIREFPESLSFEEGASIWMQYLTAYGALIWLGKLTKGDFIIITAASSSVGIAAIEIAKEVGAVSIAVTRTAAKREQLLKLGADHVVAIDEGDLAAKVLEITAGQGARITFDAIGGKLVEQLALATALKGTIFSYGVLSTEPTELPLFPFIRRFLTFKGYTYSEMVLDKPAFEEAIKYIYDRVATGAFKPVIAKTFPFSEIVDAHRYMESNVQVGKIVVTISP